MVWDIWTSIAIAYDMAIALDRSHFSGGICDCSRIRWWLLWMPSIFRSHRPHGKWTCFGDYSFQQAQLRTGNILRYSLKSNFEVWWLLVKFVKRLSGRKAWERSEVKPGHFVPAKAKHFQLVKPRLWGRLNEHPPSRGWLIWFCCLAQMRNSMADASHLFSWVFCSP